MSADGAERLKTSGEASVLPLAHDQSYNPAGSNGDKQHRCCLYASMDNLGRATAPNSHHSLLAGQLLGAEGSFILPCGARD